MGLAGCKCGKGHTVVIAYLPLRSSERQHFFACSRCDSTSYWPIFTRTSPRVPKD